MNRRYLPGADRGSSQNASMQESSKCRTMSFQLAMFFLTYVNYGILHATRSSWALATKDFKDVYGFSPNTVSDMNATFLIFYSIGGFSLSHLGDIYDKRKLILVMYSLIALIEVILGSL